MEIHFVKNRNLTEFLILFQAKRNDGATPWHLSSSYCTKMQLNSSLGHLWAWLKCHTTRPHWKRAWHPLLMVFILVTHICSIAHLHSHKDTNPKTISEHSNLGKGHCCLVAKLSDSFVTPSTAAYQAPLSMGFSRQEYWRELPFPSPGRSSWPRDLWKGRCPKIYVISTRLEGPLCSEDQNRKMPLPGQSVLEASSTWTGTKMG